MCTGILIRSKNDKLIFARTLEFGIPFNWIQYCDNNIIATFGNLPGKKDYYMTDGLNRHGLLVATFFFPHNDSQYNKAALTNKINIYTGNLNEYLLNNCKNVSDVIDLLPQLNILETNIDNQLFSLHWAVIDNTGKFIVLENKNGITHYYQNDANVITNSPTFPEHIQELKNFSYLSKYNKPNTLSQGTGALGLPGDSSSKSRFIRANFYQKNLPPPSNSKEGIKAILRIMHDFDIPLGSVVDRKTKQMEATQYTVAYSINDFYNKYANYGNKFIDNSWKYTENPVKPCTYTNLLPEVFIIITIGYFCFTYLK